MGRLTDSIMERMEERINEPTDRIIEITQSEQQRKRMKIKLTEPQGNMGL